MCVHTYKHEAIHTHIHIHGSCMKTKSLSLRLLDLVNQNLFSRALYMRAIACKQRDWVRTYTEFTQWENTRCRCALWRRITVCMWAPVAELTSHPSLRWPRSRYVHAFLLMIAPSIFFFTARARAVCVGVPCCLVSHMRCLHGRVLHYVHILCFAARGQDMLSTHPACNTLCWSHSCMFSMLV